MLLSANSEQIRPRLSLTEEDECPSCGNHASIIGNSSSQDVYRCSQCDLCFLKTSVRPNSNNDNNWYEDLENCPESRVVVFLKSMEDAYSRQVCTLEKLVTAREIVDVGCGIGIFLSVAKKHDWHVFGVDTSVHAARFALKHFNISYTQNLDMLEEGTFDVVRLSHVLEHIPEPREFLLKLNRLLRPGGILAVTVPNREPLCATVVNRFRRLSSNKPRLAGAIYPDMHVLGFSSKSLSLLVGPLGFRAVEVFTISMGNRTYFPMFYDGLLTTKSPREIEIKSLIRYWLPMLVDNLGNTFNKGHWLVGYFRKVA